MADCYYHGQSGSGSCPDCEYARRMGLEDRDVTSTQESIPMDKRAEFEDFKIRSLVKAE